METDQHRIVEARRIVGILTRLCKEHVPLTCKAHQGDSEWYGTIREIDFERGHLLLSPLNDLGQPQPTLSAGEYHCHGKLAGVMVQFNGTLQAADSALPFEAYPVRFPQSIHYHQRRATERIGVWVDQKLPVMLQLEGKVFLKGHIQDISAQGMNACFYRILPVEPGEIAPSCVLEMMEGAPVRCKFSIKDVSNNDAAGTMSIRGQFFEINAVDAKRVGRFVSQLEQTLGQKQG